MTTTKQLTKDEGLNSLIEVLLNEGYRIILPEKTSTYFHFWKDGNLGYIQKSYFFGYDLSLDCKPSKETGTGSSVMQQVDATLENVEKTLNTPFPIYTKGAKPKFWTSPEEYIANPINQILKPYIL
jgi:hypothetical protein